MKIECNECLELDPDDIKSALFDTWEEALRHARYSGHALDAPEVDNVRDEWLCETTLSGVN